MECEPRGDEVVQPCGELIVSNKSLEEEIAERCPAAVTGTVVLRDMAGELVGCGTLQKAPDGRFLLTVSACSVAQFLAASLQEEDEQRSR